MVLILFVLLFVSMVISCKSVKTKNNFLILTFILFTLTGIGVFSSFLLNKLEIYPSLNHPTWKQNNAIILLGGGGVKLPDKGLKPTIFSYGRILEAAQLYTSCKETHAQCKIIVSGGNTRLYGKSEAEILSNELKGIGIKNADIILEPNSRNTYQNAEFTSVILKAMKFDNMILVTSAIHMKRSLLLFSHFGIKPIPSAADYISSTLSLFPIGTNFALTDFAMHEFFGMAQFYVYNYLGWNKHSKTA